MNYLCAVLLLAFAAGSVHSSFWVDSEYYEEEFENAIKEQCGRHFPKKFSCVSLLSPITIGLGSILNKVTGVSMDLIEVSVTMDDFKVNITMRVSLACNSFSGTEVSIDVNVELSPTSEDGCVVLHRSDLSVSLSINGQVLNLNKPLIDEVLASITGTVTETVGDILDNVLDFLNTPARTFNHVYPVGRKDCRNEVTDVNKVEGVCKGIYCFHTEEGSHCSENVDVPMPDGAVAAVAATDSVLSSMLTTAAKGFEIKLQVPREMSGNLESIYISVSCTGVKSLVTTTNGVEAELSWRVEVFAEKDSVTAMASLNFDLTFTGQISQRSGRWGIGFQISTSVDLDLNLEQDTCGCYNTMSTWLLSYLQSSLGSVTEILNAHLDLCFQVPNPGAIPHPNVEVTPGEGHCLFVWSE